MPVHERACTTPTTVVYCRSVRSFPRPKAPDLGFSKLFDIIHNGVVHFTGTRPVVELRAPPGPR